MIKSDKQSIISLVSIYSLLAAALVVCACFPEIDLTISGTFYSKDGFFGQFMEIFAEIPSILLVGYVLSMSAVYNYRCGGKKGITLGIVSSIGGTVAIYVTIYRTVKYLSTEISALFPVKLLIVLAAAAIFFLFFIISKKIKQDTLAKTTRVMLLVVINTVAVLIIISVIKNIWGRMRYREYLVNNSPVFSAWYLPQGTAISDAFKSFPSGHTSNAVLLVPMTYLFDEAGRKKLGVISRTISTFWVAIVMISRIMCGAHYFSDVCGGAFITLTIVFAMNPIVGLIISKLLRKEIKS